MSRRAFILSGFKLDFNPKDELYADYERLFDNYGYESKPVPISWRRKTHSQYAAEFTDYFEKHKGATNIVLGNSFGAAIAYMTAPALRPGWLLLASLSPFFKEDVGNFPDSSLRRFGIRRLSDFNSYSAHEIAHKLDGSRVTYFYGEKEKVDIPFLVDRVVDSHSHTAGAKLIEIPSAGHKMRDREYIEGIRAWCEKNL